MAEVKQQLTLAYAWNRARRDRLSGAANESVWALDRGGRPSRPPRPPRPPRDPFRHPGGRTCGTFAIVALTFTVIGALYVGWLVIIAIAG